MGAAQGAFGRTHGAVVDCLVRVPFDVLKVWRQLLEVLVWRCRQGGGRDAVVVSHASWGLCRFCVFFLFLGEEGKGGDMRG